MASSTTTPRNTIMHRLRHGLLIVAVLAMLQLQLAAGELLRTVPAGAVTQGGPLRTLSSSAVTSAVTSADIAATDTISHETPCADLAETAPRGAPATAVRPGDIVDTSVIIESLDPVTEAVAFGDLVASGRRLASCRRCRCLPACSRCFIHNCKNGLCNGFCKIKGGKGPCTILTCIHHQH